MNFEEVIKESILSSSIIDEDNFGKIKQNKKRGQSYTFTIFDLEGNPLYMAKFFDYLVDLKKEVEVSNLDQFSDLYDLIQNIESLPGMAYVPYDIGEMIDKIQFQQRCFKRYINVCQREEIDCFPDILFSIEELKVNNSFYGLLIENYIDGVTLEQLLPIPSELRVQLSFDFLRQMSNVLTQLEVEGIVHRDLSPDNIMYKSGTFVVIDPGMVKISDDNPATQSSMILGKFQYASPEQFVGNAKLSTFKSDLYSLGIVALEILIGYNPLGEIVNEMKTGAMIQNHIPHVELLKRFEREIEDDYYETVGENEFTSRLLLIIKKMIQVQEELRFGSVEAFNTLMQGLKERELYD